ICSLRSTAATVFGSSRNASRSIPGVNVSIIPMASAMSRNKLSVSLKGKHGLARGPFANTAFQCSCWGQVHPNAKNISEPVLHHIQQRELLRRVELGHQIHVRLRRRVAPGDGTE